MLPALRRQNKTTSVTSRQRGPNGVTPVDDGLMIPNQRIARLTHGRHAADSVCVETVRDLFGHRVHRVHRDLLVFRWVCYTALQTVPSANTGRECANNGVLQHGRSPDELCVSPAPAVFAPCCCFRLPGDHSAIPVLPARWCQMVNSGIRGAIRGRPDGQSVWET